MLLVPYGAVVNVLHVKLYVSNFLRAVLCCVHRRRGWQVHLGCTAAAGGGGVSIGQVGAWVGKYAYKATQARKATDNEHSQESVWLWLCAALGFLGRAESSALAKHRTCWNMCTAHVAVVGFFRLGLVLSCLHTTWLVSQRVRAIKPLVHPCSTCILGEWL